MIKEILLPLLLGGLLSGCASHHLAKNKDPRDPIEGLNRHIFQFNYDLDKAFYRPVAKFYMKAVHPSAQKAIKNVLNNLDEIPSLANDILQLDGPHIVLNTWRFAINTTVGLFGTHDVASRLGLPPFKNDFGLTLYKWGLKKSAYVQLLFLGPSTWRDAMGMCMDLPLKPIFYIDSIPICCAMTASRAIPARADLMAANKLVDEALDPYVFVRDAYLQKREEDIRKIQVSLKKDKKDKEKG